MLTYYALNYAGTFDGDLVWNWFILVDVIFFLQFEPDRRQDATEILGDLKTICSVDYTNSEQKINNK